MTPPEGSKVKIEIDRGYQKIIMPHDSGGIMRFFIATFLIAWLGGWAFGWIAALGSLFKADGPSGFIIFWLVGWTVGGFFAFWFLFRLLRPTVPEELLLSIPSLVHDSGVSPLTMSFDYRSQMEVWKKMLKKRKTTEFGHKDIPTLRLRDVDGGNRVTIDKGTERIDLGLSLSEVEREWLFSILAAKYNTEQGSEHQPTTR